MIIKKELHLKPFCVNIKEGKKYAWCTCNLSSKQPFCDGSHSKTKFKPLIFTAEVSDNVYLCGCKNTKKKTYCDGSHNIS